MIRWLIPFLIGSAAALIAASAHAAPIARDFPLGQNGAGQSCRAQTRFSGPAPGRTVDIYCGDWERPSGSLYLFPEAKAAQAQALLAEECAGDAKPLALPGLTDARQLFCTGDRRLGLSGAKGGERIVGYAFPADWTPLLHAAEAATGLKDPRSWASAKTAATADTPGLNEIRAVYPDGAPDQGANVNFELLRRRAYENNVVWAFGASGRDFGELLRAQRRTAPDDKAGEAEILAELALNLSDASRFEDAADTLKEAETQAKAAHAELLLSKLDNYRALDALNRGKPAEALAFAQAGIARRTKGSGSESGGAGGFRIASTVGGEADAVRARSLLLGDLPDDEAERRTVLSAQGYFLAGVAADALDRPESAGDFDQASRILAAARRPPGWLAAQIEGGRARLRLGRGDISGAEAAIDAGLRLVRGASPGSREEGRLLMLRAEAEGLAHRPDGERTAARQAIALFTAQRETPGLTADLAAVHLGALLTSWTAKPDPATAAEYFETLSLVWDGAAARSASQLAARLASDEASGPTRTYQDAERRYRAALALRLRLASTSASPTEIAAADREADGAGKALAAAEAAVRTASPRYLELLKPALTTADLQGVLRPGEGYLRLVLASDRGYGALVTRDGVSPFEIPLGKKEIEGLVTKVRKSAQIRGRRLPDYDIDAAEALYAALVAPVAKPLAALKRIQIDAAGPLAAAPFAALVEGKPSAAVLSKIADDQDYRGVAWLGAKLSIANAVGPASFVSLRRAKPPSGSVSFAGFGDFIPAPAAAAARIAEARQLSSRCIQEITGALERLSALPETANEVRDAAALFKGSATSKLGADFTDTAFLNGEDAHSASVILLGTHGVLGLSPCFAEPALLASPGAKGAGLISASDLLDRRLSARLVIMSACDTAGGARSDTARTGLTDGGEALSGLARAFLYAGASSVLATQWKVDSTTSSAQTKVLLREAIAGKELADALADAQRQLFANSETAHPFYWAAFTLIGDGGAQLTLAR